MSTEEGRGQKSDGTGRDQGVVDASQELDLGRSSVSEPPAQSQAMKHATTLSLIVFASIWGTLTREGLVALNTYAGQSVAPLVWAQAVGCLVMGSAIANKARLDGWYPPLYVAITTGYCGSVTTFSSWILEVFRAFGDQHHYGRGGLHNLMDALSQTFVTLGISLICIEAGRASGLALPLLKQRSNLKDSQPKASRSRETLMIIMGPLFWGAASILCGTYKPFRHVTYALILSPPGAVLRWYLARLNQPRRAKDAPPRLPLGTLAANLLATAVLSAAFTGQRVGRLPGSAGGGARNIEGCHALYGLQEGFCGCLSTISTFASELVNMGWTRRALLYAVLSWVVGVALCILLVGAPWWSRGMDGSCVGITL